MLFVLLHNLFGIGVKLQNFAVRTPSQENVLFVVRWMELDAEWRAAIGESTDGFACLCVPKLNGPIVARA